MSEPNEEDYPYDKPMTQPSELAAAGIPIAFASFDTSFSRRLSQQAGNAVAYGLSHDEALRAITVNAAKMLGVDDQLGTIETGKLANIIVTDGDPLEIRTQVRYLFIKGQPPAWRIATPNSTKNIASDRDARSHRAQIVKSETAVLTSSAAVEFLRVGAGLPVSPGLRPSFWYAVVGAGLSVPPAFRPRFVLHQSQNQIHHPRDFFRASPRFAILSPSSWGRNRIQIRARASES